MFQLLLAGLYRFSWTGPRWQGGKEARRPGGKEARRQGGKEARKVKRTYIDVLFPLGR